MELLTKYYVNLSDGKEIIKENFTNWTSGNEIIDNFIQEKQLKCAANDFLFEWIPYNEFVNIKEIGDNCLTTAIWKNGPLHYHDKDSISGWIREPFKIVTLKFLYGIQNITNKSINKVESYLHDKKYFKIRGILQNPDTVKYYGISQNPDTKIYILVFNDLYLSFFCEKCGNNYGNNKWCKQCQIDQLKNNFTNWTSGNVKLDQFIQKMQLKVNEYYDVIFEWIPYNELIEIRERGDNCLTAAIWKDGPLHYDESEKKYIKNSAHKKVVLRFLYDLRNIDDEFLNLVESYLLFGYSSNYGISQDPDSEVYILVFIYNYFVYHCEKCGNKYKDSDRCCDQCQINQLKNNFTNWTSENVKLDDFIQKLQLKISRNNLVFEWIPYNEFIDIKQVEDNCFAEAIWKDGPLHYDKYKKKFIRNLSYEKVVLRFLYDSQDINDEFLNMIESYLHDNKDNKNYGISQDPDTKVYILVFTHNYFVYYCEKCGNKYKNSDEWCNQCQVDQLKSNFTNWTSGNIKLDDFIQNTQLKIDRNDVIFEWIPYSEFIDIKQMGDNCYAEAIWKDGPLYYDKYEKKYIRNSAYKKVVLRFLYDSQNISDEFLNMVGSYLINGRIYGISQNPDTKVYTLIFTYDYLAYYCRKCGNKYKDSDELCKQCQIDQLKNNFTNWTSGNVKLDDFIQKLQLNLVDDLINSLIQKLQLKLDEDFINDLIKKLKVKVIKNDMVFEWMPYNEFVDIKHIGDNCLATAIWKNGPLNYDKYEKKYIRNSTSEKVVLRFLYDSQNIDDEFLNMVGSYLLFDKLKNNFTKWTSGNVKLDNFIRNMQLKINENDVIFEWISYSEFIEIKKIDNEFAIAIWKCTPLTYTGKVKGSCKTVCLKYLCNKQDITDKLLNKVKSYFDNNKVYGISQNPDTKFTNINETENNRFATAIWEDGPLYYIVLDKKYKRKLVNEKVILKYLSNSQNTINEIIYSMEDSYGISQNPNTKDFIILVFPLKYYCENCGEKYNNQFEIDSRSCLLCQTKHKDEKIRDLIQDARLNIDYNSESNIIFEWIPYDHFDNIKEIGKGGFSTVYLAIWKDGLLYYERHEHGGEWKRKSNTKVALKCLHYSFNFLDKFINEVKAYLNQKLENILKIYGISQDPDTKDYIMILEFAEAPEVLGGKPYTRAADIYSFDQNFQKKEQQHYEIEKQFNETQEYRKANFCSIKNDQTITHTQAIYSSRLLNPFTKNLSKYDNINNNTVEITDFTNNDLKSLR
ncbi:kinase-like domain-containing protein [Rhizophagus clarus]|uniref:Kinase-like domain-containing protein n=1 Tax=Rhizophagus clarus TaxID=94130 RepID=A0A8H3LZS7_9GLOM|nr:kinase-like domain-containing protein [Rhizophagus clarus]